MNLHTLNNPVITAPMAGITDRPFREILHSMGAGLVFTEMISDKGLTFHDKKTLSLLNIKDEAAAIGVQLCGSDPATMGEAAAIINAQNKQNNIKVLDINMGCPVNKIVKNGEGSKLMTNTPNAVAIVQAVVKASALPVTVKMRLGWDDNNKNVLDFAQAIEQAGATAITIHGRTRQQLYSGTADWTLIKAAGKLLSIPVIGNGDINSSQKAYQALEDFNCAGIMIGRAMIGNPWLIRDTVRLFQGLPSLPKPTISQIIDLAIKHLKRQIELNGERLGICQMRSQLPWYLRGKHGAAAIRHKINQINQYAALEDLLLTYCHQQEQYEQEYEQKQEQCAKQLAKPL